jgi:hypothetical protein
MVLMRTRSALVRLSRLVVLIYTAALPCVMTLTQATRGEPDPSLFQIHDILRLDAVLPNRLSK